VPVEPLAGKIVIDTNNYYHERDEHRSELDEGTTTSAELLQAHLPTSKIVKAFNNINFKPLGTEGRPAGTADRWALPIAGDDAEAKRVVTALIDELGFDVVDAGALSEGWRFQRDTPCYGVRTTRESLIESLAAATR
jgi:predicted dinucleotide-binding enzyme